MNDEEREKLIGEMGVKGAATSSSKRSSWSGIVSEYIRIMRQIGASDQAIKNAEAAGERLSKAGSRDFAQKLEEPLQEELEDLRAWREGKKGIEEYYTEREAKYAALRRAEKAEADAVAVLDCAARIGQRWQDNMDKLIAVTAERDALQTENERLIERGRRHGGVVQDWRNKCDALQAKLREVERLKVIRDQQSIQIGEWMNYRDKVVMERNRYLADLAEARRDAAAKAGIIAEEARAAHERERAWVAERDALQAKLDEERACHDCSEYRAMMAAKLAESERAQSRISVEADAQFEAVHAVEDADYYTDRY